MCRMNLNTPAPPLSGTMDVDEFMAFLEARSHKERWDLIEGIAVMMAPPSHAHQRIASNLSQLLNTAFAARKLDLFAYIGTGIRSPGVRNFQPQPDVVVVPGVSGYDLYSERFQLVAEVLSPTNRRQEIDLKLREFLVAIYSKRANWQPAIVAKADDPIEMPEFGLRCRVADLYVGTPLDPLASDIT
jgi:Uma2 family endonuclease